MILKRSILLAALLVVQPLPTSAAEPTTDVRVLIDVSGSMKDNDPANLRVPALRLLTGLMPMGARGGIWMFAETADQQLAPAPIDDAWKQRATQTADAIHWRGQRTDIETALKAATADWESADTDSRRSVILLTDGVVDTGSAEASDASRARILAEGIAALESSGAAVHAIALSAHADHDLLRSIAIRTGGWYERADDAGQLERLFLRMFEKATQPDTVPINGNRFSVDGSIDEMTVLVFREPDAAHLQLTAPEDVAISAEKATDGVVWRSGNGYDMVTVTQPAAGEWQISAEVDPDNRVMVITDLKLEVRGLPSYVQPGSNLAIAASLAEGGERVVRADFLRLIGVNAHSRSVDGETRDLIMLDDGDGGDAEAGDGEFGTTVTSGDDEGVIEVLVTADSGTFVREKRFTLEVLWPLTASIEAGEPRQLLLVPRADVVDTASLAVQARLARADGETRELSLSVDDNGGLRVPLPDTDQGGELNISVTARTLAGDDMKLTLPAIRLEPLVAPPPVAEAESPAAAEPQADVVETVSEAAAEDTEETAPPDWMLAATVAVTLNVVAGLALAGFMWWRKRRQNQQLANYELALAPAG